MPETFAEKQRVIFRRRQRIIAAVLTLALVFTGYFVYRAMDRTRSLRAHRHESVRGWMTIRRISRAHGVPPREIKLALGLDAGVPERRTLAEVAADQDRSVDDLILIVEKAIAAERLKGAPIDPGGSP